MEQMGHWIRTSVPLVLLAVLSAARSEAGEPQAPFDVEKARKLIAELGPQKAAEQVANDSPTLEAVSNGVVGAGHEWLDVGAQLMATTNEYLKDRLLEAFGHALQRDAAAVLERGASGVPIGAVCGRDPFAAVSDPPTRDQFLQAIASRERAVAGVKRADLLAAKDACQAALTRLRAAGAKQYAP